MAILDKIKTYCEVDDTTGFDEQLLDLANECIADMVDNNIPVSMIDATTETFVNLSAFQQTSAQSLINLYCLRTFDKNLMTASATSQTWIDNRIIYLMHQLKAQFDNTDTENNTDINVIDINDIIEQVKENLLSDSIHVEEV